MMPSGDEDIVTVLAAQHDQVRALLTQLHDSFAPLEDPIRAAAGPFQELVRLLAIHETAEQKVVYPVLKSQLQAADVADPRLAEEHEAKRLLSKLERMAVIFEFPATLAEFEKVAFDHADHEEQQVFPLLRDRIDADQRRKMAVDFRAAQAVAPTHPHPHAPDSAVGNFLVGPVLATIDRVRDAIRERSQNSR